MPRLLGNPGAIHSRARRPGGGRHPPLLRGDSVNGTARGSESRGWRWARGLLGPFFAVGLLDGLRWLPVLVKLGLNFKGAGNTAPTVHTILVGSWSRGSHDI